MIIGTLVGRDLRARLRDRSALVLALFAPAALITVLSLTVAGPDTEAVPVGLAGDPADPVATALREGPLATLDDEGTIVLSSYDDPDALRQAIEDGDLDAGIAVTSEGIEVFRDPGGVVGGAISEAVAQSTALTVDGVGHGVLAAQSLGGDPDPQALALTITSAPATSQVVDSSETAAGINPKTQLAGGMATFFLFFAVQFGVLGLLQERREGTLPRLLVAPIAPWQVLLSKLLVSFVIGIASMGFLLLFSSVVLGADFGNVVGVSMLAVTGVLAAVSTVTLVLGLASTPAQAGALQSALALVLGVIGGAFFSMARAGGAAAVATRATPHFWFNEGLVRLTGGRDWTAALEPVGALLLFSLVVGIPGLLLARRTVRP
jgi:linearmycin/streptolysin S transport system permease protein